MCASPVLQIHANRFHPAPWGPWVMQAGGDLPLPPLLVTRDVAYHLAKFDHLVFLAAVDHALGHEQAGKLALAVFHVLSGDEHAGPQQHARLAGRLAAVAEEYAGLAARAAAQAQLHQLCRFGDGLYADRAPLRNFALKAAYHAEHPVVAALGLQAE